MLETSFQAHTKLQAKIILPVRFNLFVFGYSFRSTGRNVCFEVVDVNFFVRSLHLRMGLNINYLLHLKSIFFNRKRYTVH
jgi:hypothetical protein